MKGNLYLIPNTLGGSARDITAPITAAAVQHIDHFIIEEIKSARRFLRAIGYTKDFEEVQFTLLNEHSKNDNMLELLEPAIRGKHIGVISEAGVPCVADPGAVVVKEAHALGIRVIPLTGPSSILLTVMASGLNGQSFAFNGYLPRDRNERVKKIKQLEMIGQKANQTQLFMDAPYRNEQVLEDLLKHLSPKTMLCIATDLTMDSEQINTRRVDEWQAHPPKVNKRPVMFAML